MATSTYDPAKTSLEALHWVRWRVGDLKADRPLADDAEIATALAEHSLIPTTNPISNLRGCRLAAAKVCDAIAAQLASKAEITVTGVGIVKSTASDLYRKMAADLRAEANRAVAPSWNNHEAYPTTHVAGVDAEVERTADRTL